MPTTVFRAFESRVSPSSVMIFHPFLPIRVPIMTSVQNIWPCYAFRKSLVPPGAQGSLDAEGELGGMLGQIVHHWSWFRAALPSLGLLSQCFRVDPGLFLTWSLTSSSLQSCSLSSFFLWPPGSWNHVFNSTIIIINKVYQTSS